MLSSSRRPKVGVRNEEEEEFTKVLPFHSISLPPPPLPPPPTTTTTSFSLSQSWTLFWSKVKTRFFPKRKPEQMQVPLYRQSISSEDDDTEEEGKGRNVWAYLYRRIQRDFIPESIWLILSLLGATMSIASWIIDEIIDLLQDVRNDIGKLPKKLGDPNVFLSSLDNSTSFLLWWLWAMFWGLFAVGICKFLSPQAEGLGIEQIRTIMTGFALPGYLTLDTMVAKILGLIAVQAAGVNLGIEGPFVHIACSLAILFLEFPMFQEIKANRNLTRQVLSAACATGISSIFGSPVGGVLFAIEITSNVYHTADYWKAFYTAVLCKFLYSTLSYFGNARGSQISMFPAIFVPQPFVLSEIPLFLLLSLFCGLLGGLLVKVVLQTMAFSRKHFNLWIWTVLVISLHAIINWCFGQFMKRSLGNAIGDLIVTGEMVQSGSVSADYHLQSLDWGQPNLFLNLILFCMLNSLLFVLSLSLQVPSGTLIPMFAVGMSIGRFFGEFVKLLGLTTAVPAGYALVGASAFVAGCTGATSTAMIVFELTGQLAFMVPILLAVVVGRASGEVISPDLYEALQIYKNLPNIPPLSRQSSFNLRAKFLMNQNNVPALPRYCTIRRIRQAVLRSSTTGLGAEDVFAMLTNEQDRFYLTSCTRKQLLQVLERQQQLSTQVEEEDFDVDLLGQMVVGVTAPTCTTSTPAIDVMHLFEQSLSPTVFVTKQSRVVGFIDLAAVRHLIELHNL